MQLITLTKQMEKLKTNFKKVKRTLLVNKLKEADLYSKKMKLEKLHNRAVYNITKKRAEITALEQQQRKEALKCK